MVGNGEILILFSCFVTCHTLQLHPPETRMESTGGFEAFGYEVTPKVILIFTWKSVKIAYELASQMDLFGSKNQKPGFSK